MNTMSTIEINVCETLDVTVFRIVGEVLPETALIAIRQFAARPTDNVIWDISCGGMNCWTVEDFRTLIANTKAANDQRDDGFTVFVPRHAHEENLFKMWIAFAECVPDWPVSYEIAFSQQDATRMLIDRSRRTATIAARTTRVRQRRREASLSPLTRSRETHRSLAFGRLRTRRDLAHAGRAHLPTEASA